MPRPDRGTVGAAVNAALATVEMRSRFKAGVPLVSGHIGDRIQYRLHPNGRKLRIENSIVFSTFGIIGRMAGRQPPLFLKWEYGVLLKDILMVVPESQSLLIEPTPPLRGQFLFLVNHKFAAYVTITCLRRQ